MEIINQPWPWYIAGPIIGLTIPLLLILGNKRFGISSNFRHICAACIPGNISLFNYDWRKDSWNLVFVFGMLIGGFIAGVFMANPEPVAISAATMESLKALGIKDFTGLLPDDLFSWQSLLSLRGFIFIVIGGFLVGFGTRYAGGCTSGHAIMGLSNLQWPSLVATVSFMIGGIIMTHLIIPYLLSL